MLRWMFFYFFEGRLTMKQKTLLFTSILLAFALIGLVVVFGNTVNEIHTLSKSIHQQGSSSIDRKHFILIVEEYDHAYWKRVANGAMDSAKNNNISLEIVGPFRSNISEHKILLEKAVASKVDGIIIQGLDDAEETPIINKAVEKGIPVITIDTDAAQSNRFAYVGTDNFRSGYLLGRYILEQTKSSEKIGIISGVKGATNQRERVGGLVSAFKNRLDFEIVDMGYSDISRLKAAQEAVKMLREHSNITIMIGTSGLDVMGIYDAVKHQKRNDVSIYGYDDMPETIELIQGGYVKATVVQKPYTMGLKAVDLMVDYTNGHKTLSTLHTDTKIISKEDLK